MKKHDKEKKVKVNYLAILAGHTASEVVPIGKLKDLGKKEKKQVKN